MIKKDPDSLLSTAYQKFETKLNTPINKAPEDWSVTESLLYIYQEYKKKFGFNFTLSYKDSPSTSPEYKMCKRLWMMLEANKNDGPLVKQYIDFFYSTYISKSHFISIGALTNPKRMAAFKKYKEALEKPTKSTPLPDSYLDIVKTYEETSYIKTYGDLAFLKQAMMEEDEPLLAYRLMFSKLKGNGFKIKILDEVM